LLTKLQLVTNFLDADSSSNFALDADKECLKIHNCLHSLQLLLAVKYRILYLHKADWRPRKTTIAIIRHMPVFPKNYAIISGNFLPRNVIKDFTNFPGRE